MSNVIISPSMSLPVPITGEEAGPQYANDVNTCLNIIDSHNHASGSGVQITPDGLNINSDLPMNINDLTLIRTTRFSAQSAALPGSSPDLRCLYVTGVDLYYNDGNGNQIPITASGGVAGSPGSIANLTAPASATYVSADSTFVWQSAASTAANMDFGSAIFRNLTMSSNGVTLSPPASIPTNYSLILPNLPASQKFMTLDASGNITAPWSVDNSTLEVSSNLVQVKNLGITTAKIANAAVTRAKMEAVGQQVSSSCGTFSSTSTSQVDVTNLTVTLTTTGRPVLINIQPDGTSNLGYLGSSTGLDPFANMFVYILRDGSVISNYRFQVTSGTSSAAGYFGGPITYLDTGATAASHTYKIQIASGSTNETALAQYLVLAVWEL